VERLEKISALKLRLENILFYTQPTIVGLNTNRPYVAFKHLVTNKRYRIFSGLQFGMGTTRGLDNRELSLYFRSLLNKVITELGKGWSPDEESQKSKHQANENKPLKAHSSFLCDYIDKADYSAKHKYSLRWYWGELLKFAGDMGVDEIETQNMQVHLMHRYATSNTSYNTAKRYYKCIFNLLVQLGCTMNNPVVGIKNKKAVASINQAFEKAELTDLLAYLKINDKVLYRVAILMYTTFMRPHQEIRRLKVKFFNFSEQLLILPPRFTKNGKQVTIPLQQEVLEEFGFLRCMDAEEFVFGDVNSDYFATRWGKKIRNVYPLKPNQTLYSIRHTAAVEMYKRTKDVALIQRMMHHSSMEVTIGYLRSLNCNLAVVSAEMYPSL
jgi:integrase